MASLGSAKAALKGVFCRIPFVIFETCGRRGHVVRTYAELFSSAPEVFFEPKDVDQLKQILALARDSGKTVKVIGEGHSQNAIAQCDGYMISLKHFNKVLEVDQQKLTVTVEGGIMMEDLYEELAKNGIAMSSLQAISDLTLAGALSTATHGTGIKFGSLSTFVTEIELLKADGTVVQLVPEKNGDTFLAACGGLGALGIILSVKLQCEKAFKLQMVRHGENLQTVLSTLDEKLSKSEHVTLAVFPFTDDCIILNINRTTKDVTELSWWSRTVAHFIFYTLYQFLCWLSLGLPCILPFVNKLDSRLSYARMEIVARSDKVFTYPPLVPLMSVEYAIPIEKTGDVLLAIKQYVEKEMSSLHPLQIIARFGINEDLLLSPCYKMRTCHIMVNSYRPYLRSAGNETRTLEACERLARDAGGRPHWGKIHTLTAEDFKDIYPQWQTFIDVRNNMDPQGMFLNDHLKRTLGV